MGRRLRVLVGHLLVPQMTAAPFTGSNNGADAASAAAMAQKAELEGKPSHYAASGPAETEWGIGFRDHDECAQYCLDSSPWGAGGVSSSVMRLMVPLRYYASPLPAYSHVPSHSIWKGQKHIGAVPEGCEAERKATEARYLYFPSKITDGREDLFDVISSPETLDELGFVLLTRPTAVGDFYDHKEVARVYYPECEKLLMDFVPGAKRVYVFDHNVRDKDNQRPENQEDFDPGVQGYAHLVHNDYTDNSGPGRARELLTKNLRSWNPKPVLSEEEADAILSSRFMEVNLWRAIERVTQYPVALCTWPSFADQEYITNYRIYDDRVGETQRFTYNEEHEWYYFPEMMPNEVAILKCYDSVTDGSVARWSFHTSFVDHSQNPEAPCRKSIEARAFVFF